MAYGFSSLAKKLGFDQDPGFLSSYRFLLDLKLEGNTTVTAAFKSVSGIGNKQDVISYKLGGDRSVRQMPGRVSFNNITLERGLTVNNDLVEWRRKILEGGDMEKLRVDGAVVALGRDKTSLGDPTPLARYNFYRAWPIKWDGPGFTAGSGDMAVEKLELAIEWGEWEEA